MNQFNPEAFMQATVEQALSTERILLPVQDYHGVVTKLEAKSGTIGKGEREGQIWAGLKITVELNLDESVKAETGRDKGIVSTMVMLDLTDEGMLDLGKGKNVELGRWYEATGLNEPNMPKSPAMMEGRSVVVALGHRADPNDPKKIFEDIKGVRRP